jgi:mannose-1-phosphate guanylyltransferase
MARQITKAILLVGGKGTRLAPITNSVPKPMIRIAGKPVTEHQIAKAREAGITEIVLATSYLAEVFQPYFGDGADFGVRLLYAVEEEPLGTGGAIAHAASSLNLKDDESIFIFNGDVLSGHDLQAQADLHQKSGADVTLHLTEVDDARAYGCVPIDAEGRVNEFLEKMENPKAKTINAGCYIFSTRAIHTIPVKKVVSVERETFPQLLTSHRPIYGYQDSRYWIDMGTPSAMIRASRDLIMNPHISSVTPAPINGAVIESGAVIDSTSEISEGSFLATGVRVGARSKIRASILGEGVVVDSDATIAESYIAPGTRVTSGSIIEKQVFGF